jgi:twitching motility protein PilJ
MPESNKNKLLPSIKSRILLSSAVVIGLSLAGVLISGYLMFILTPEMVLLALLPLVPIPFASGALGWWLMKEISESLSKVAIGAQMLERGGADASIPTTGAKETEEILDKLQCYSQGMQRMSVAMEQVARGELNVSMRPSSTTDRFGLAFQKLLEETSAGVKLKTDLNNLQHSLRTLTNDVAGAKYGDLSVEAVSDNEDVAQLAGVVNQLVQNMRDTVGKVRSSSTKSQNTSQEIQKTLNSILEFNDKVSEEISDASITLKQLPKSTQRISEKLADSSTHISRSLTHTVKSVRIAKNNLSSATVLRGQIDDASRRFQRMSDFSREAGKIVKVVEDMARRTNLIALNASIQANEAGEAGNGFSLIVKELEQLAERASGATKEFSTLTRIIQSEATEARSAIEETVREAAGITKFAGDTMDALSELEKNITQLSEMQENIVASAQKQNSDSGEISKAFLETAADSQKSLVTLKTAIASADQIIKISREMSGEVASFKLPFNAEETKRTYLGGPAREMTSEMVN